MKEIHSRIVEAYETSKVNNPIINTIAPIINKKEQSLSRGLRRTLAQLRIGKSPFLLSYLHKIDPTKHNSPLCPLCSKEEHTTQHLFKCEKITTKLTPLDLWTNPVEVAELLQQWGYQEAAAD